MVVRSKISFFASLAYRGVNMLKASSTLAQTHFTKIQLPCCQKEIVIVENFQATYHFKLQF